MTRVVSRATRSNPALARTIDFYNVYHQMWALTERNTLMHCGNSTFVYHSDFNKYMKAKGANSENIFYYLFDGGAKSFCQKRKEISASSI